MTFKLIRRDGCTMCQVKTSYVKKLQKVYETAKYLWREDGDSVITDFGLYDIMRLKDAIGEIDPKYKDDEE